MANPPKDKDGGSMFTSSRVRRASFFQLVRVLSDISWPATGHGASLDLPGVRFRSDPSLAFPVSDVTRVETRGDDEDRSHVIDCTFMGLCGVGSPLPVAYLMELAADENEAVRDFLDVVNHRLMVLFFRAWQRYRYLFQITEDRTDPLSTLLLALSGYRRRDLEVTAGFSARFLIYWAGLVAARPSSSHALQTILRAVVHPRVRIEECVLRRVEIPEDQTCRLDARTLRLGRDVTIGRTVLDRTGKFRILIDTLTIHELPRFLPGGEALEQLDRVVRLMVRAWLDYEVALVLSTQRIAGLSIGGGSGARLHLTSWLGRPRVPRVTLTIQGTPGERRTVRMARM